MGICAFNTFKGRSVNIIPFDFLNNDMKIDTISVSEHQVTQLELRLGMRSFYLKFSAFTILVFCSYLIQGYSYLVILYMLLCINMDYNTWVGGGHCFSLYGTQHSFNYFLGKFVSDKIK